MITLRGQQERRNRSEWGAVALAALGTVGVGATAEEASAVCLALSSLEMLWTHLRCAASLCSIPGCAVQPRSGL